ncbi:hypothetical protein [Propionicicella superfundia]|uniref:hypothetical protein n=1 Tax=Propionicicella superfundia TaxID=348582 RepID=UPI00048E5EB6|nr:hypothetical protein [Propionicicella superfundia]
MTGWNPGRIAIYAAIGLLCGMVPSTTIYHTLVAWPTVAFPVFFAGLEALRQRKKARNPDE